MNKTSRKAWSELANQIFLPFMNNRLPRIKGIYRGREVVIVVYKEETSDPYKSPTEYNQFQISVDMQIGRKLSLSLRKFPSRGGIKMGDQEFDRDFVVESHPGNLAQIVQCSNDLRQKILQFRERESTATMSQITSRSRGVVKDVHMMRMTLDIFCDVSEALEGVNI